MSDAPDTTRSSGILLLTDDRYLDASKTTYYFGTALRRLGLRPFIRDTSDARWFYANMDTPETQSSKDVGTLMISSKFVPFLYYAGIDHMLSINMHWLFPPESMVDVEHLKHVYSLWYSDLRDVCSKIAVSKEKTLCETITNPKIRHYVTNAALQKEAELFELPNVRRFQPAAPSEFLEQNHPCIYPNRIAFLGGPGTEEPPSPKAVELIQKKDSLKNLQYLSREEILEHTKLKEWEKEDTQIRNLLADALEAKMNAPFESALNLLYRIGENYPSAFEKLKSGNQLSEAAVLVKLVNRYHRPAIVCRIYSLGILDVHNEPQAWLPYGIQAKPHVKTKELIPFYQSYAAYLNIPRVTHEITINEKLFEIAACARYSFNLHNPDLDSCFQNPDEIFAAQNENELEEKIQEMIQNPEDLFNRGQNARKKVESQHTWDLRMESLLDPVTNPDHF